MELNELLYEREWRSCKGGETQEEQIEGFFYFCENYWFIRHPERGRILFELREAQQETIDSWHTQRYNIVLKARQIGFSTLAAAYAFWLVFFWPDRFIVMLSRTEREAAKLLQKSKYGYRWLPLWMKERGPAQITDHQLKMVFDNESAIESLPSSNDPARGESVYLVIVDEMAFLPNPEEAWASIEPIADVGGRIITLSTANGSGNFFHEMWVGSQTGTNLFTGLFFPWSAGARDESWYETNARTTQLWQLHQEYPRSPEEAFIKSGNPVFDVDSLDFVEPVEPTVGDLIYELEEPTFFKKGRDGGLSVWEDPETMAVYVIGADVAEGLSYGDYSSAHVINAGTDEVVASWHGHVAPDIFGVILAELGWWYNNALIGVENNNHGLTTLKALQKYGYKNIYKQRRQTQARAKATDVLGWRTSSTTKPLMIDELSAVLREQQLYVPCRKTIGELRTFVRKSNGKMSGSPHDDRVISLAIANQMLKYVWLPEYDSGLAVPRNSMLWWEQFIHTDVAPARAPIGSFNVRNSQDSF